MDHKIKRMKKQQQLFDDNENQHNQSCPTVMEDDITKSMNQEVIHTARSQQIKAKSNEEVGKMGTVQKNDIKNQTRRKFGIPQESLSEPKIKINIINKRGTDFDCQIVQSVELSCAQLSYNSGSRKSRTDKDSHNCINEPNPDKKSKRNKQQQIKSYQNKKNDEVKQEILNVLIAGAQDTGKTTFIRCFNKKQRKKDDLHVRTRTRQLKCEGGSADQNLASRRNSVYFVDLPGFSVNEEDKYLKEIEQYAFDQWVKYDQKPEQDRRIHCCLYFLRGPRIKQIDVKVIKKLSQMFNLIPIITKSDQYTKQQVLQIKEQFHANFTNQNNANFYDIEQFLGLQFGAQKRAELMSTKFGKFPPFAISSSTYKQSTGSSVFMRKYPWGTVQIQNQQHTQFSKLCELLSQVLKKNLITKFFQFLNRQPIQQQYIQEAVVNQIVEQPVSQRVDGYRINLPTFIVGSLAVTLVGLFSYFKLKGRLSLQRGD